MKYDIKTFAAGFPGQTPSAVVEVARCLDALVVRIVQDHDAVFGHVIRGGARKRLTVPDVFSLPLDGIDEDFPPQILERAFPKRWREITEPWWDGTKYVPVVGAWDQVPQSGGQIEVAR